MSIIIVIFALHTRQAPVAEYIGIIKIGIPSKKFLNTIESRTSCFFLNQLKQMLNAHFFVESEKMHPSYKAKVALKQ